MNNQMNKADEILFNNGNCISSQPQQLLLLIELCIMQFTISQSINYMIHLIKFPLRLNNQI